MLKYPFFSIYFINQKGLFVLDVHAPNEEEAFDFIRTLTLKEFGSYIKYFERSSSLILHEAKMKERDGYSFNTSLEAGKQGFLAGWKSFILKSRKSDEELDFQSFIFWWVRSFINDYNRNPPTDS